MRLAVRTWNVFHGNAHPPRRAGYLRRMVALATQDDPDVVCLQEIPVWALRRLADWSGMQSFDVVARRPIPLGLLSTWITGVHLGRFRSALVGQANAILVARRHVATDLGHDQISDRGRERRVVQAIRLEGPPSLVVANLHATNEFRDPEVPRSEARRARDFVDGVAGAGEAVVLAGDFNVEDPRLEGFSTPGEGIDDILVRGAIALDVATWPVERRTVGGIVLSDHAPIDCVVEVSS